MYVVCIIKKNNVCLRLRSWNRAQQSNRNFEAKFSATKLISNDHVCHYLNCVARVCSISALYKHYYSPISCPTLLTIKNSQSRRHIQFTISHFPSLTPMNQGRHKKALDIDKEIFCKFEEHVFVSTSKTRTNSACMNIKQTWLFADLPSLFLCQTLPLLSIC